GLKCNLYILPSKDIPGDCRLSYVLQRPVAWVIPSQQSHLHGTWHIVTPISLSFDLQIRGYGPQMESPSSKAGLTDPKFHGSQVWSHLRVSTSDKVPGELGLDICGDYEWLPDCGAAGATLHRKLSAE